jgi:hypothetical protein
MPDRCVSTLVVRRNIDAMVRQVRTEMAEAMDALQKYGSVGLMCLVLKL